MWNVLHLQPAGPRKARPLAFSPLPSLSSPRAPLPLPNPNQPCARGVAGLRSCPVTPTSSPLRSAPCHAAQTSVHERRREARMCGSEGKLGGVGGAQSASLPSTCKGAPPRTSPDAQTPTPMRFHPVLRAPAPPVHASPWSAPPSACASPSARIACVPSPAAGSYKSLRNRYVRLYMNAVESSILFLLDFGTICGVAQSEWNSQTWSLIDHPSVPNTLNFASPEAEALGHELNPG